MSKLSLFAPIRFLVAITIFTMNTIFICTIIFFFGLIKKLSSNKKWTRFFSLVSVRLAHIWADINGLNSDLTQNITWDIRINCELDRNKNYLVIANHQSWTDIVVLQKVLNRRIPFLRFFIKQQLMYVPFLNGAWWALDFPFLRRHSREYLKRHPEKMGEDIKLAKQACERFKDLPTSILIFAEGTRRSETKAVSSPFKNLLPPKTGGISTAIDAMGENFATALDVTIVYPGGAKSLLQMFAGQIDKVIVQVDAHKIPKELLKPADAKLARGLYLQKKTWLQNIWAQKDLLIDKLLESSN